MQLTLVRYVLSPTHLHEFKSADRIYSQPPVMSLFLPDQKLGSHAQPGSSSYKFILKGRQTGTMHRGHSWIFRAETYETMLAWYDAIRTLTSSTGKERDAYVRKHARSMSAGSYSASISGDSAMEDDEADANPYSADVSSLNAIANAHAGRRGSMDGPGEQEMGVERARRPQPGGRFPSDLAIGRDLRAATSPSSGTSEETELHKDLAGADLTTASGGLAAGGIAAREMAPQHEHERHIDSAYGGSGAAPSTGQAYVPPSPDHVPRGRGEPYGGMPLMPTASSAGSPTAQYHPEASQGGQHIPYDEDTHRYSSNYGDWMAPAAGGAAVGVVGGAATEHYWRQKRMEAEQSQSQPQPHSELGADVPPPRAQGHTVPSTAVSDRESRPSGEGMSSIASPASSAPTTLSGVESVHGSGEPKRVGTGISLESHTAYDTGRDGSLIAKPTGAIFPSILRHNTDVTVRDLHVPGEYPATTPGV